MIKSVHESTIRLLVNSGAVSRVTVVTVGDSQKKKFAVRFQIGADELPVASKREPVRMWSSLDTVVGWLQEMGVSDAALKIV